MPDPAATTITNILRSPLGARYLRTDHPRWRQGRDDRLSKTRAEAEHEKDLLAKALRRDGGDEALDLAAILDGCSPRRPCLSGGCPSCMTATQKIVVDATRKPLGDLPAALVADVVDVRGAVRDGKLDGHAFDPLRRKLDQALKDCGVRAFGGFDISANRHEHDEFAPFWCPHARIFTSARLNEPRVHQRFRAWFPQDAATTPHPVHIEAFDGKARGRAYAFKPDFFERISLERGWRADGSRSPYSTRFKPIWGQRRVELALALHQTGLDARLYLRGYELMVRDDAVELVRTAAPSPPERRPRLGDRDKPRLP